MSFHLELFAYGASLVPSSPNGLLHYFSNLGFIVKHSFTILNEIFIYV